MADKGNDRLIPIGSIGVAVDVDQLTFKGFVSIIVLMLSRGRIEVWKAHGKAALKEIAHGKEFYEVE